MKKVLFATLALPLAFAACTNEEFDSIETPNVQGDMITLNKNFGIGVSTNSEIASRADYFIDGNVPYFTWEGEDEIGLGWLQNGDGKIYTNYQFEPFAYGLYKDATKAETLVASMTECDDPALWKNIAFFTQADHTAMGDATSTYVADMTATPKAPAHTGFTLNTTSAFFRTSNLTIFKGKYLVYYPFDKTITEAGNLIAKSDASFDVNTVKWTELETAAEKTTNFENLFNGVANELFAMGTAEINGGTTATGFGLQTYSGLIRLQIAVAKNATKTWNKINKVAIYSADGIQLEMAVNAADETFIADDVKETKAIYSNFTKVDLTKQDNNGKGYFEVLIPALPQTITNAYVALFDEAGNSVMVPYGDIEVKSAKDAYTKVNVTLTDANALQNEVFYVVDMETFAQAMGNAGTSNATNVTIKLISDIVYDMAKTNDPTNGLVEIVNNIVIEGGKITVPADHKLLVSLFNNGKLTFNNELVIEDKGCCGDDHGSVKFIGKDKLKNAFVFNGDITNNGYLTIGEPTKQTVVTCAGAVENNEELVISALTTVDFAELENNGSVEMVKTQAAGQEVSVDNLVNEGEFTVGEYTKLTIEESLVNNGTLEIKSIGTEGDDGTIEVAEDAVVTNNATIANKGVYNNKGITTGTAGSEFIDYVGSQSISYNKIVINEGAEYICEVNTSDTTDGDRLAYALNNNVPTTTVRFVEDGKAHEYQLGDYKASYAKLATVKYIVDVANTRDVLFKNNKTELTFGTGLVVKSAKSVKFNGHTTTVNGNVTVNSGTITNNGTYSAKVVVAGDLTIDNSAYLLVNPLASNTTATQATAASWTVAKNVELKGTSKLQVEQGAAVDFNGNLTVAKDATATFKYSSYSDILNKITVNGTFIRELSSGSQTANPALVWCGSYDTKNGTVINGGPQKR